MKNIASINILTIISLLWSTTLSQAQDGGESAAEASVTGSASQPAVNPPDATDSNPIVTVVRAGIPVNQVLSGTISLNQVLAFAKSSGDMSTLIGGANLISQGKDVSLVTSFFEIGIKDATQVGSALDAGLTNAADAKEAIDKGIAFDKAKEALDAGLSLDDALIALNNGIAFDKAKKR